MIFEVDQLIKVLDEPLYYRAFLLSRHIEIPFGNLKGMFGIFNTYASINYNNTWGSTFPKQRPNVKCKEVGTFIVVNIYRGEDEDFFVKHYNIGKNRKYNDELISVEQAAASYISYRNTRESYGQTFCEIYYKEIDPLFKAMVTLELL